MGEAKKGNGGRDRNGQQKKRPLCFLERVCRTENINNEQTTLEEKGIDKLDNGKQAWHHLSIRGGGHRMHRMEMDKEVSCGAIFLTQAIFFSFLVLWGLAFVT